MITARIASGSALLARLSLRAKALAEASAENRLRTRAADPWRWRRAQLLWPLITKDRN